MKIQFLILFLLFLPLRYLAQETESKKNLRDSLRKSLLNDSIRIYKHKKFKPYANIDFRNAYVDNNFLSLAGIRGGVTYHVNHTFGLAYYTLNKFPLFKSDKIKKYQFNEIDYLALFYEYQLFNGKIIDVLLPFEIGYGNYTASYNDETETGSVTSSMIPTGVGIKFILMPHAWIGIKFGGGYRYVYEQSARVGLDGAYFTFGIRIDLDHFIKDMRYFNAKKKFKHQIARL